MRAPANQPEVVNLPPMTVAVLRETVMTDALPEFFERAFIAVGASLASQGIAPGGPPVGIFHGIPTDTADVSAGYPTDDEFEAPDGVHTEELPAGKAARILHVGMYDTLKQSYTSLMAWLADQELVPGPLMWETYLTDPPGTGKPGSTQTRITWPLVE